MLNLKILVTGVLGAGLLAACLFDGSQAKRGTVVDNEVRVGILHLADGSPAVNARVRIYPVDHTPDSVSSPGTVFSGRTNSHGQYFYDSLPAGQYNVLGDLDGEYSYQDSLYFSSATDSLPTGTLDKPGSIAGIVGMQPNHDPRTALVQVLGTDRYASVDDKGRFKLSGLAGGKYGLRVVTTENEYTPLVTGMQVRAGRDDSLADTLRLVYTGIPVVTGLKASYDTLRAIVRLSWNPVPYRNLSEYQVYRDSAGALELSRLPVGLVADTVFEDTLLKSAAGKGIFNPGDSLRALLEYRVRVKNKSDQNGLVYGNLKVTAAAPGMVRTRMLLRLRKSTWNPALQVDSIDVTAALTNPNRGLDEIAWAVGSPSASPVTRKLRGGKTEGDSLRFGWGESGPLRVYVTVKDDAGNLWKDSLAVAGNVGPKISGTPITSISAHIQYRFKPSVLDPDGDEISFSIKNRPVWAGFDSSTGIISGTPTNAQAGNYAGISILVTDGRRTDTLPPFALKVAVTPWIPLSPNPKKVHFGTSAASDGKIFLFGGVAPTDWRTVQIFDTAEGTWSVENSMPEELSTLTAHALNGKIFVFGANGAASSKLTGMVLAFDPKSGAWESKAPIPTSRQQFTSAVVGGKVYVIGGQDSNYRAVSTVEVYNPATDTWDEKNPSPILPTSSSAAVAGKIYLAGYETTGGTTGSPVMKVYDPVSDKWSDGAPMKEQRSGVGMCSAGNRIYAAGGWNSWADNMISDALEEYDPASDQWSTKTKLPVPWQSLSCSEYGGSLYFFGGDSPNSTGSAGLKYDPAYEP